MYKVNIIILPLIPLHRTLLVYQPEIHTKYCSYNTPYKSHLVRDLPLVALGAKPLAAEDNAAEKMSNVAVPIFMISIFYICSVVIYVVKIKPMEQK